MQNTTLWKNKLFILDKRIKAFLQGYRQNIAILGDDEEEISYLLESYFLFNKSNETIYIHITTSYANKRNFFKSVAISLLSNDDKTSTLDNLINQNTADLQLTVSFIKQVLKKNSISFFDILELINKFINEKHKSCIFIIEEFLELKNLFPDCLEDFSKFLILQRNCMVILTASSPKEAEKIISSELNLLFGNFEKILLNEISFFDYYIYLKQMLSPVEPSPLFSSFFGNILGTNILYYNFLVKLVKAKYSSAEETDIAAILEDMLYSKESYLYQRFMNKINLIKNNFKNSYSVLKILLSLSEGYLRKNELLSLNICDAKEFNIKLSKLCEMNYVENYGDMYKIKDALFSLWLSQSFKLYYFPSLADSQKRQLRWRTNIQEEISFFKEDFLKDKVKKILELISSFKDDSLKIGKNKYKLPSVERTKIVSYPKKDIHILIGEGKEIIFMGIKEKDADDSDIFDFVDRGKSIKGKGVKKIFVSLDRLSHTAKVIAKNHKLIVWDANEINSLMRVYNKPAISLGNPAIAEQELYNKK